MRFMPKTSHSIPSDSIKRSLARESAEALGDSGGSSDGVITITIDGRKVEAPDSLLPVLRSSLRLIGEGQAVAVVAVEQEIGTQEAADLLGVSRPFLVKLLDHGEIPSRKVGIQRRVLAGDVLAYKEAEKARRRETLVELAAEDQRLRLDPA